MRWTTRPVLAALALIGLLTSACGGDDAAGTATDTAFPASAGALDSAGSATLEIEPAPEAGADTPTSAAEDADTDTEGTDRAGGIAGIASVVFDDHGVSGWRPTAEQAASTFRTDATVGAFRLAQSWLDAGVLPPVEGIRAEEWINALDHAYPAPAGDEVWAVHADAGTPWWQTGPEAPGDTRLLRIGLRATDGVGERPPASLTFDRRVGLDGGRRPAGHGRAGPRRVPRPPRRP
ncbi:VWA domain-containing protein [Egicoccus halophilus]|uniref:Uncharacterized protein YfbK N-terminal domain-containing protein n=1 Tax=Egicoccus halophilus TaxID=1670830 RepID=A0A8J3EX08_9ACTN|nr:von Willebrand factor type A domain-containing protein [Egicoccus halophilus]GGI04813.1 hypothetical protein GCM10011354_10970 [Egicoccus halophilus]